MGASSSKSQPALPPDEPSESNSIPLDVNSTAPAMSAPELEVPGKKSVEIIRSSKPEDFDDDSNQTGLSHYEIRMQERFYSVPEIPRNKHYQAAKEADAAKRVAKAERKAEKAASKKTRKKSKKKSEEQTEVVPHTVEWGLLNAKKVGVLNLSKMDLSSIPDQVFDSVPGTARVINLAFNRMTELDKRLCDYVLVQRLMMTGNFLQSIPHDISRMTALTKLDLARNKLTALPDAFGNLKSLKDVDLSDNLLTELPPSFSFLTLKTLDLSRNKFTIAPIQIASMQSLTTLNISANSLIAVPDEYMALRNLRELNLDSNKISDFPNGVFALCVELVILRLRQNPIVKTTLEGKESYITFEQRRQVKVKRQIDHGSLSDADLLITDS